MEHGPCPSDLPDDELLRRVATLVAQNRRNEADLVAHLAEVDDRRLYLRQACTSLFIYCTTVLHVSEAEAFLRITAARASRQHPMLMPMLADGRLHLSAIVRLAPHLTADNRDAVLARAVHRSKRQIEELVAELAPKPDAPALIRKLPERPAQGAPVLGTARPVAERSAVPGLDGSSSAATSSCEAPPHFSAAPPAAIASIRTSETIALVPDRLGCRPSCTAVPRPRRDVIETTSPGRYMVQFTASAALREKLERLRALMVDAAGANDLAAVIEQAVTEKLERLEARRFGRTKRPCLARRPPEPPVARPAPREVDDARDGAGTSSARGSSAGGGGESQSPVLPVPIASRHIPAAIRRAVYERAGGRCTYTDERGRRCEARTRLHFHHRLPWAYGGRHEASLITLLCSSHHALATEAEFGVRWSRRLLHGQGGGKAPNVDAR